MVDLQKMDKSAIVDGYDQISEIIDHNLKLNQDNPKKLANWENIKANIESTFEPFATCPDLIGIYEKKYADKPDDIELLTKITNVLERKKCTDSELFFNATEKLHKLQPSAQSAYLMGSLNLEKNNISKAAEYMQEAANLFEDNTDKIRALNLLANINFNQRNYSQARANAQKILQLDPNYGKAYILIGDLYAASSSMCTEDDMGGKTVFWAAVDKYVKARNVDPSVEAEANNKIGQYSKHFPPASDLFFRDLNEGGSYTVGCWINETTTIRAAK
jgi:tetratricopeptide (TPR) repeat protein